MLPKGEPCSGALSYNQCYPLLCVILVLFMYVMNLVHVMNFVKEQFSDARTYDKPSGARKTLLPLYIFHGSAVSSGFQ